MWREYHKYGPIPYYIPIVEKVFKLILHKFLILEKKQEKAHEDEEWECRTKRERGWEKNWSKENCVRLYLRERQISGVIGFWGMTDLKVRVCNLYQVYNVGKLPNYSQILYFYFLFFFCVCVWVLYDIFFSTLKMGNMFKH